jgi:hypothetical protein
MPKKSKRAKRLEAKAKHMRASRNASIHEADKSAVDIPKSNKIPQTMKAVCKKALHRKSAKCVCGFVTRADVLNRHMSSNTHRTRMRKLASADAKSDTRSIFYDNPIVDKIKGDYKPHERTYDERVEGAWECIYCGRLQSGTTTIFDHELVCYPLDLKRRLSEYNAQQKLNPRYSTLSKVGYAYDQCGNQLFFGRSTVHSDVYALIVGVEGKVHTYGKMCCTEAILVDPTANWISAKNASKNGLNEFVYSFVYDWCRCTFKNSREEKLPRLVAGTIIRLHRVWWNEQALSDVIRITASAATAWTTFPIYGDTKPSSSSSENFSWTPLDCTELASIRKWACTFLEKISTKRRCRFSFRSFESTYTYNKKLKEKERGILTPLQEEKRDLELARGANEIIPGLWVGGRDSTENTRFMEANSIGAIVHAGSFPEEKPTVPCLFVRAGDSNLSKLREHFREVVDFVEKQRKKSRSVVIKCEYGVHRAPTLAAAYLIKKANMACAEAIKAVEEKRESASIPYWFVNDLKEFSK